MRPTRSTPHILILHLVLFLVVSLAPGPTLLPLFAAEALDPAGHWEGAIETPNGKLRVKVDLQQANGGWTGTIDIPQQGAKGMPLEGIHVEGESVQFAIAGVPGAPTFKGQLSAEGLAGSFAQGPAQLTFNLTREVVPPPARPQTPRAPFAYSEEEARYQGGGFATASAEGKVDLVGTLTIPQGEGPHPAVLLLTGSGAQDRDETIFDHKPFWVIAHHLTEAGVAVLRVDDRGVGGSTGHLGKTTIDDLADDALAGVQYLKQHSAIDGGRIGVLGHSEGGLVGPLAASRSPDIAFVISLAGPGVPGDEILVRQLELIVRAGGADEETTKELIGLQTELMAVLKKDPSEAALRAKLSEAVQRQSGGTLSPEKVKEAVDQQMHQLTSPWFQSFVAHDPREALAKIRVPFLALNGGLDLQVDPEQNLPEIARALEKAGNKDVTTRTFAGLNHLFQHATTGLVGEYGEIEETFAPEVLEVLTEWTVKRFRQ